jgi:hypothetical protein
MSRERSPSNGPGRSTRVLAPVRTPDSGPSRELVRGGLHYDCEYHTLTNFNTITTISSIDVRNNSCTRRVPQYGRYPFQTAACSFSVSRGSRDRRVPTRPVLGESDRESLGVCHGRTQAYDARRWSPDALTRITRPPYGLPVRGWRTRGCRLLSSSSSSAFTRRASGLAEVRGSMVCVRS